jgi:anaerobic ribonucleoside-triphosphate reductase
MPRIREVRKRDQRIVPFDESKIADAVYAAFRSVGEGDRALAGEMASVVTHFLEEKFPEVIPGIEDIQDVVETALIEMGHTRVAKAYILYRQKRAMLRDTLEVRKVPEYEALGSVDGAEVPLSGGASGDGEAVLPAVELVSQGVTAWQKGRIVAALIREADIDPGIAEEVASQVERRVFDSGLRRISTALIRELVDNELFDRGFGSKLRRLVPVGIPKYNLEQILFGLDVKEGFTYPKTPPQIRDLIANRILHQYTLQEVFTPAVSGAHGDGRIFIHRLSDPVRLLRLEWTLPPPVAAAHDMRGGANAQAKSPDSYLDASDFFRKVAHLSSYVTEEFRLVGIERLLLDPALRGREPAEAVVWSLEKLCELPQGPALVLELPLAPESLAWLAAWNRISFAAPRKLAFSLRFDPRGLRGSESSALLESVADLYERGERLEFVPPLSRDGGGARLSGLGGKITLNLPRAAFRSARDRRHSFETEIEGVLALAIKGHLERRRFLERLGANRENPLWGLLGGGGEPPLLEASRLVFAVGLLGLNECVKFLSGLELHQSPKALARGLEIARIVDSCLRREERGLGIRLRLEETLNQGPLRALERIDRVRHRQTAEIDRGRSPGWSPSYTSGVRYHHMAPVDPLERAKHQLGHSNCVEAAGGILEDFPELRSAPRELLTSLLEECAPLLERVPQPASRASSGALDRAPAGRKIEEKT